MENKIIVGCNYHTKWQSNKSMRFVLKEVKGDKALLITRRTNRSFWTNISDLVFIESPHNIKKGELLSMENKPMTAEEYLNKTYLGNYAIELPDSVVAYTKDEVIVYLEQYAKIKSREAAEKAWNAAEAYNFNYHNEDGVPDCTQYLKENFD